MPLSLTSLDKGPVRLNRIINDGKQPRIFRIKCSTLAVALRKAHRAAKTSHLFFIDGWNIEDSADLSEALEMYGEDWVFGKEWLDEDNRKAKIGKNDT